jgi:streptogramin lyase
MPLRPSRFDESTPRLEYDLGGASLQFIRDGERLPIQLRAQADRLVRHMVERNAELGGVALCNHDELLDAVWPSDTSRSREELARLVWELRTKLQPLDADALVETERKRGYRLHAFPVDHTPTNRQSASRLSKRVLFSAAVLLVAGAAIGTFFGWRSAATTNAFSEFSLPQTGSRPIYIANGRGDALWFTEYDGNKIGRIAPSGAITEYPIPSPNCGPEGIAPGPDGNMWFAESNANAVAYITPAGSIVQFMLPHPNSRPESVVAGPGPAVWFTEDAHRIGRITSAGRIAEFNLPRRVTPGDIALGPDGNLWFDSAYIGPKLAVADQTIGRITPAGTFTLFTLPTKHSAPGGIAAGGGYLWDVETQAGKIARITTSGHVTEYPLGADVLPAAITAGRDGAMWFTEKAGNLIGEISSRGTIRTFHVPTPSSGPHGIAVTSNGAVWLTEIEASKIARLRAPTLPLSDA